MLITDKNDLKYYGTDYRVWQGIPGIARTKGGRTFITFYSGDTKETYGNFVVLTMSDDGVNFSEPVAVAHKFGKFRCFDPVLWIDPIDRLWFIWNVMPGEEVMATICNDPDADTLIWSEEFCIGRGIMMNKPLVLSSGEWLFPIALWQLDIYNEFRRFALRDDDIAASYVYKTSDNGKTFIKLGGADVKKRTFDEHMLYEMNNGVLRMLVRLQNGIADTYSYDRGKTWSRGQATSLGGPSSRFFIKKLRSGRVLLINHHKFTRRNNLTAFLSEDDGKTFPYSLMIDERDAVSYPDAVEMEDGSIYIVYDRERGCFKSSLEEVYACAREILTARITEDDIINGKFISEGSYTKRVVSKLTRLADGIFDPFMPETSDSELAKLLLESEDDPINAAFEHFPINCDTLWEFNAKKFEALVTKFRESGNSPEALSEVIKYIRGVPKKDVKSFPLIETAKSLIEAHLSEDYPLTALADEMNVSVYYLSHLFKTESGISIVEYRNELRLTKAKLMLINTEDSIAEIAVSVGFCSSAYFAEVFSRSESITPSEYRRIHKR